MAIPTTTLSSGDELPMAGIGTWRLSGDTVRESVRAGLDAGYGHVDTAEGYKNEREIGDALAEYDRDDFFLTYPVARSILVRQRGADPRQTPPFSAELVQ